MRPGALDVTVGDAVLRKVTACLGDYVAVADHVAWELSRTRVATQPVDVIAPPDLDQPHLDELARMIPPGVALVGVGGGLVMDATKYLALSRGQSAILVPSITSGNAPMSDAVAIRRNGLPVGIPRTNVPKRVVVDLGLLLLAEPRLNRAGYGDLLACEGALGDAPFGAPGGDPVGVETARAAAADLMLRAHAAAPLLDVITAGALRTLTSLLLEWTLLAESSPAARLGAGSEHLFAWTVEAVTGRHFMHGEVVALGTVIAVFLQGGDHQRICSSLDAARVRFRPRELGLSWPEVKHSLCSVSGYNRRVRRWPSVFDHVPITGQVLHDLREAVGG